MELSKINIEIEKYQKAIEYNQYLIDNNIDLTLIEYIKDANKRFYEYDISFMEEFMNLVDRVDFCIPHEYLIKYKVVAPTNNSNKILDILNQRGLDKNTDYYLLPVKRASNK